MPDTYPIVVLAPVVGLATYCIFQIAVARLASDRSPYYSLAIGFMCGLGAVLAVASWAASCLAVVVVDRVAYLLLDIVTYLALAFGYFNFVNLTVASLRIRLLEEIQESGGGLPRGALMKNYDSRQVVAIRLDRLVRGGHLMDKDSRLHSGRLSFLIVARIFDGLHWFIIGNSKKSKVRT